tara:strand:+ start:1923 stop:2498 length:576 start_codon:yes stop_codon:yes gene_type:complete
MDEYKNLEDQICEEIREWSRFALEKPNKNYNNLPSCPFAKTAWKDKKVSFAFKNKKNNELIYILINNFNDNKDLIIIVDMCFENNEKFHAHLNKTNELIQQGKYKQKDIWLMGFHPNDDVNELIDDGTFANIVKEEYALIFVQRLTKLQESANKLKKLGYYDKYYNEYNVEDIYEQRQQYYNKLKRSEAWQ